MNRRLQIAIQKSGRLTDHSLDLLSTCGLKYTRSRDQLLYYGENMPIDILLVRDDDIPELVSDGTCDLGIAGQNVTAEVRHAHELNRVAGNTNDFNVEDVLPLDFGHCKLMTAGPRDTQYNGVSMLEGKRIATSYPGILKNYLDNNGINASIVRLSGSVEIAPRLGKADFICDLVSSGATLAANQLSAWDVVFESEAVLLRNTGQRDADSDAGSDTDSQQLIEKLVQRMRGVLQVKESKYIMLHAPRQNLEKVTSLLPGNEFPTILPIEGVDDKVVVHAVCRETVFWETLEALKAAGASSILVLPVEKMMV